jgi:hypothetical protein
VPSGSGNDVSPLSDAADEIAGIQSAKVIVTPPHNDPTRPLSHFIGAPLGAATW